MTGKKKRIVLRRYAVHEIQAAAAHMIQRLLRRRHPVTFRCVLGVIRRDKVYRHRVLPSPPHLAACIVQLHRLAQQGQELHPPFRYRD